MRQYMCMRTMIISITLLCWSLMAFGSVPMGVDIAKLQGWDIVVAKDAIESEKYAAENTGDEYYWSRLIDTVHWALHAYLHYDGEYGWGKKGLVNERFCYTDALLTERFADGAPAATWFCGHSWASGSVLEGLTGRIFESFANGSCRDSDVNTNHVGSLRKIRK